MRISDWSSDVCSSDLLGLIASTAVFLVVPYAFNYDLTVVSLASLVFLARAAEWHGFWTRLAMQLVLSAGLILPLVLPILGKQHIVIGPAVLALILGAQLWLAIDRDRAPRFGLLKAFLDRKSTRLNSSH